MTAIEAVATLFGVACVWLTVRQNVWCWPTGLVQVALYIAVFWNAKLYSDVILHAIYVVLSFYGWWHWLRGGDRGTTVPVTRLGLPRFAAWSAAALLGAALWGTAMANLTDAALPYPDAFVAAASLVAQWLMARKLLESWIFWIVVDVVAIGVYLAKNLYLTSGLYALFLGLAIAGWLAWRRALASAGAAAGSGPAAEPAP